MNTAKAPKLFELSSTREEEFKQQFAELTSKIADLESKLDVMQSDSEDAAPRTSTPQVRNRVREAAEDRRNEIFD